MLELRKLLQPFIESFQNVRWKHGKHNKKYLYTGGKKCENIIYYPRNFDNEDPLTKPSKLFRVQRIKPVKGNPYWEKRLLKELGLDKKTSEFTVVKNLPENNARLWKVKHLVKVTPITFPFGEPTENDVYRTFLKENGECIVTKEIGYIEERLKAANNFEKDSKRLDTNLLRKDARLKWLNPW